MANIEGESQTARDKVRQSKRGSQTVRHSEKSQNVWKKAGQSEKSQKIIKIVRR